MRGELNIIYTVDIHIFCVQIKKIERETEKKEGER